MLSRTLALTGLLLACATTPPATEPAVHASPARTEALAAAPGAAAADPYAQRADELLKAMQSKDPTRVETLFDDDMRAQLPPDKLSALLLDMQAQVGAILSWSPVNEGKLHGMEIRDFDVAFEKSHLIAHVVIEKEHRRIAGLYFKALQPPYVPPQEDPAAPFRSEQLKVGSEPFLIGATITIPKTGGPFPAAVLVPGSGPQDRDETIGPNKPFRDIAEGLSAKGVIVLRLDKRTLTYGYKMDAATTTVDEEEISDAVAAVSLLRSRPDVDPKRIFIVGHSLGAMVAPEIALRAAPIAGIAMLAPAARPLPTVVIEQLRFLGAPPEKIQDAEATAKRLLAGELKPDDYFMGVPVHYWTDLQGRDEIAAARKFDGPILILRGERDFQTSPADLEGWRQGLATQSRVTTDTMPGLNHLFIKGEGKPNQAEYGKAGHVDAAVIDRLSALIGR